MGVSNRYQLIQKLRVEFGTIMPLYTLMYLHEIYTTNQVQFYE